MSYIVYEGSGEVIITTPEKEAETLRVWFVEGGRDLEEYDRDEYKDEAVSFSAQVRRN